VGYLPCRWGYRDAVGYRAALEYGAHRWTFTPLGCVCLRWSRTSTRTRSARTPPRWRFQRLRSRPTVQLSMQSTLVAQSCFRVFCVAGVLQGNERRAAKVAGKGILAHTCTRTHARMHMHMHMRTHQVSNELTLKFIELCLAKDEVRPTARTLLEHCWLYSHPVHSHLQSHPLSWTLSDSHVMVRHFPT